MKIATRIVNRSGLAGQLSPVGNQGVIGRGFLGILPLIGAYIVEDVGEILNRLGFVSNLLQHDGCRMGDAVLFVQSHEVLQTFPDR